MESDDEFSMDVRTKQALFLPIFVLLDVRVENRSEAEDVLTVHPLEEVDLWADGLELVDVLDGVLLLAEAVVRWDHER